MLYNIGPWLYATDTQARFYNHGCGSKSEAIPPENVIAEIKRRIELGREELAAYERKLATLEHFGVDLVHARLTDIVDAYSWCKNLRHHCGQSVNSTHGSNVPKAREYYEEALSRLTPQDFEIADGLGMRLESPEAIIGSVEVMA